MSRSLDYNLQEGDVAVNGFGEDDVTSTDVRERKRGRETRDERISANLLTDRAFFLFFYDVFITSL